VGLLDLKKWRDRSAMFLSDDQLNDLARRRVCSLELLRESTWWESSKHEHAQVSWEDMFTIIVKNHIGGPLAQHPAQRGAQPALPTAAGGGGTAGKRLRDGGDSGGGGSAQECDPPCKQLLPSMAAVTSEPDSDSYPLPPGWPPRAGGATVLPPESINLPLAPQQLDVNPERVANLQKYQDLLVKWGQRAAQAQRTYAEGSKLRAELEVEVGVGRDAVSYFTQQMKQRIKDGIPAEGSYIDDVWQRETELPDDVRRTNVSDVLKMEGMRIFLGVPNAREMDAVHARRTVMVPAAKGKPESGWQGSNNRGTNGDVWLVHQWDQRHTLLKSFDWHLLKDVDMGVLSRGALDAAVDRLTAFGPGVTRIPTASNGEQYELSCRVVVHRSALQPVNGAPRFGQPSFYSCVASMMGAAGGMAGGMAAWRNGYRVPLRRERLWVRVPPWS
jgi:hypothetical protein